MEQFSAVQALAPSSAFHLGHPPSYPKHGQYQRVPPPQDDAEEDSEQAANAEEEEEENEKRREKNTEKKIFSTCSSRLLGYIFSSALTEAKTAASEPVGHRKPPPARWASGQSVSVGAVSSEQT
jgi:hypothetical protein